MKLTKSIFFSIFFILPQVVWGADYLRSGLYEAPYSEQPTEYQVVNQRLVKDTWSYKNSKASGWYFCGHAAFASAFNILRDDNPGKDKMVSQLEWFHTKLKQYQPGYTNSRHKQASGDYLLKVVNKEKSNEFWSSKRTTTTRDNIKKSLHKSIRTSNQFPVVLSQAKVGSKWYGHFYVVYKVDYQPGISGGGTVYFADPLYGRLGTMGYTTFLNKMRDGGTKGRYSLWIVGKK